MVFCARNSMESAGCYILKLALLLLLWSGAARTQVNINYGDCMQDAITAAAEIDIYQFSGQENEIITCQVSRSSGTFRPKLELYDPNGVLRHVENGITTARIDSFVLPITGTYKLLVSDGFSGTLTGNYGAYLQRLAAPLQARVTMYDSLYTDTLAYAGCMRAFTFPRENGLIVRIQVSRFTGTFRPRVELYGPDGTLLHNEAAITTVIFTDTLTSTGQYTILISDSFSGTLTGNFNLFITPLVGISGGKPTSGLPASLHLMQNYPNPFNPSTAIRYRLSQGGQIRLTIFNSSGQSVRTLVNARQIAGEYTVHWDGTDDQGAPVASGAYLYRLSMNGFTETKKMLLIR